MQIAPIAIAVMMVALLAMRGGVRIPAAVLLFLAYVAWALVCVIMIDSTDRMIGFALRWSFLAAAAVVVVYVYNAGERVTRRSVMWGLTWVWSTVLVGGYLGILLPDVTWSTPVGMLLPDQMVANEYVHDLFFPRLAEVQHPWGAPHAFNRPAAPFPYTNSWGAAAVLLTPVVVALIASQGRRWMVRIVLLVALGALLVPAVATSNRGMFLGFGLCVTYVAVRLVMRGRSAGALGLLVIAGAGVAAVVAMGLVRDVTDRQTYGQSTQARSALYAETWARTLDSPIFGYGAPRPSITNVVSAGTQGYLWMAMFSYGLVGLALLLAFLVSLVTSTWKVADTTALWLHAGLVVVIPLIVFYGLDVTQWTVVALVAGLLLRARDRPPAPC